MEYDRKKQLNLGAIILFLLFLTCAASAEKGLCQTYSWQSPHII